MKKIFWTSIVWIVLFGFFLLYMKWFNQPLAQGMTEFLIKGEENIAEEIIAEEIMEGYGELTGSLVEEVVNVEMPETFSSENLVDTNWTKLFEQLDRIEILVEDDTDIIVDSEAQTTEDDVFDEFKVRYEQNKK